VTKRELFDVLADVPDDADILISGCPIGAVASCESLTPCVVLEESAWSFEDDSFYRILFDAGFEPCGYVIVSRPVNSPRDNTHDR
jgi:hypothetical protein